MPWFKVDDGFWSSPKVVHVCSKRGGLRAIGLWCRAGSWCAEKLTGGHVPMSVILELLKGTKADAELLCDRMPDGTRDGKPGLWERVEGGYQFHDWDDYQPDAEAERAAARERMRTHRAKKREQHRNRSANVRRTPHERSPDVLDPQPDPDPDPIPIRSGDESDPRDLQARETPPSALPPSPAARPPLLTREEHETQRVWAFLQRLEGIRPPKARALQPAGGCANLGELLAQLGEDAVLAPLELYARAIRAGHESPKWWTESMFSTQPIPGRGMSRWQIVLDRAHEQSLREADAPPRPTSRGPATLEEYVADLPPELRAQILGETGGAT